MLYRKSVVAGSFYPDNPAELAKVIDKYLSNAEQSPVKDIVGLIAPHAGYIYSGPVAAYSYNHIKNSDIELAVVLAPSHRARFKGAMVMPSGVYETPLGEVLIDETICGNLIKEKYFDYVQEIDSSEHSLEVQIPFLQRVLKKFKLVPVIIGSVSLDICRMIADQLYAQLEGDSRRKIIVVSTDLSHYHPYENAVKIDNMFIEALKTFDDEKVSNSCNNEKAEACGQGPILTGISLSKKLGAKKVEILKYANSGDTAGSKDEVVGYLSAAFVK